MDTLGLDTIAGSRLLQLKFGPSAFFQPDQAVMHEGRRARVVRMSGGAAIIRPWGSSESITVPVEALSLPPADETAGGDARRRRTVARAEMGRLPRRHPQRRPALRPQ
jgi:hypothetical protein